MLEPNQVVESEEPKPTPKPIQSGLMATFVALTIILLLGGYFRFVGINWDAYTHLHPDERFLTIVTSSLEPVDNILQYLRTSESTLNPYNKGQGFYVYGNFPMTATFYVARTMQTWQSFLCPAESELLWCTQVLTGYDGVHIVGRLLSGLVDLVAVFFTFLIGRRLYGNRVGLVAAFLMATAVMPIQQSHFYTMDNWASALTTIAIYIAILAAEDGLNVRWWVLFGIFLGLTVASRINVAPLALIAGVAGLVWLGRQYISQTIDSSKNEAGSSKTIMAYINSSVGQQHIYAIAIGGMIAALVSLFVFRVAMPYAFADAAIIRNEALAETGTEPSAFSLAIQSLVGLNPQWWANMEEIQRLQAPEANFPPALQWTDRPAIIFPLVNMLLYGMGPLAGLLAWIGVCVATWQMVTKRQAWLIHAIPVIWIWMYFLFSATRWVKSIRYFLPIYPVLFVMAGWLIIWLYDRWSKQPAESRISIGRYAAYSLGGLTLITSLLWANAFVEIYRQPMTRVAATEWMFDNVPSGATLQYTTDQENRAVGITQLPMWGGSIATGRPTFVNFSVDEKLVLDGISLNYVTTLDDSSSGEITLSLNGPDGTLGISRGVTQFEASLDRARLFVDMEPIILEPDRSYTLEISTPSINQIDFGTSILTSEHWDDALPVRYDGKDPFSQYFRGVSTGQMTTTHPDSEQKAGELYDWLNEADYVVISSQRSAWSLPRLALTYPLMIRYYEALFAGELGFDLVAQFHGDIRVGPLYISDTTGQIGWGEPPNIGWPPPGPLAAEEAFSVYDHPPVWIFKKSDSFDPAIVGQILSEVDVSDVIVQNPLEATNSPNGLRLTSEQLELQRTGGTFSEIFNINGVLSNNGFVATTVWWLFVILLGWVGYPIAFVVFPGLADRGYALSRIVILLLLAWASWFVASYGWFPNTAGTIFGILLVVMGLSAYLLYQNRASINSFVVDNWKLLATIEAIGLILFLGQLMIRLGNPDVWDVIWGGEKPMDTSYFTAVLKSTVFPPYDPWQAGAYINYYYFGFVYTGVMTKLLKIVPTVAYNLILPTLFSFTGAGIFAITYTLAKANFMQPKPAETPSSFHWRSLPAIGGYFAVLLAMVLGNLRQIGVLFDAWVRTSTLPADASIVMRFFEGGFQHITGTRAAIYPGDWFWTATRAISINEGEVQPITEFPFFTFLYGDLHAHMIALPLTIVALGWAISLVISGGKPLTWLHWVVGGLAIGVLYPTNSWDYPTYMVIGLLALVYINIKNYGLTLDGIGRLIMQGTGLYLISRYAFQPFWANFGTAYGSIRLWEGSYTPVADFVGIYGLFLFVVVTWLLIDFKHWSTELSQTSLQRYAGYTTAGVTASIALVPVMAFGIITGYEVLPLTLGLILFAGLLGLRPNIAPERRIVNILVSSAFGLTLFVEIFVLDGDIGRMNTVFKFYMQVWIFLAIAAGAGLAWAVPRIIGRWGEFTTTAWFTVLGILLFVATLYPLFATWAKFDIRNVEDGVPLTLDGAEFMSYASYGDSGRTITLADDREAILWMQSNINGSPVVAEAHSGNPYRTIGNRISMYTGLPAIIGWDWHQRQQRPTLPGTTVSNRISDVNALYRAQDLSLTLELLEQYEVEYVYFGQLEDTYYGSESLEKFEEMVEFGILEQVYENETVQIFQVVLDR